VNIVVDIIYYYYSYKIYFWLRLECFYVASHTSAPATFVEIYGHLNYCFANDYCIDVLFINILVCCSTTIISGFDLIETVLELFYLRMTATGVFPS